MTGMRYLSVTCLRLEVFRPPPFPFVSVTVIQARGYFGPTENYKKKLYISERRSTQPQFYSYKSNDPAWHTNKSHCTVNSPTKFKANVTTRLRTGTDITGVLILLILCRHTCIGNTLQCLTVSHAVPTRSGKVTVAFKLISECCLQANSSYMSAHSSYCYWHSTSQACLPTYPPTCSSPKATRKWPNYEAKSDPPRQRYNSLIVWELVPKFRRNVNYIYKSQDLAIPLK
jgi:hypothetical protein